MIDTKDIKVGSKIEFDNGLLKGKATVMQIADKKCFEKANGESIRYILAYDKITAICSPSEIKKIYK